MKFFAKGLSHGDGYHCKAIGLPADFKINVDRLNEQLALRRAGAGRSDRMKSESDRVEFLSGVSADFVTDGRPLEFFIKNKDDGVESKPPITALRSGHADFVGCTALGLKDARYVCERASARRTAAYVAFGEICRQILESKGIFTYYLTRNVGGVKCDAPFDYRNDYSRVNKDDMHCPSDETKQKMLRRIQEARAAGDRVGRLFSLRPKTRRRFGAKNDEYSVGKRREFRHRGKVCGQRKRQGMRHAQNRPKRQHFLCDKQLRRYYGRYDDRGRPQNKSDR